MKLSAPIFQLKRRARLLARHDKIALHEALDRIARDEGFVAWSLLAVQAAAQAPATTMLSRLTHGDLLLLGARPGHGKTRLGLQLLLDAVREGRDAVFFTLEYSAQEARRRIDALEGAADGVGDSVDIVTSEDISADYIIAHLSGSPRGTVALVDYLQILDQQRSKPALADQLRVLRAFTRENGIVLVFISQIDRAFDPANKPLPDIQDIRLPNPVDIGFFTKACFVHNGEIRFQNIA
ncbi:MAG: DNA helicase [Hyphomicrobiales bacterium]|nr:MAG: DNA helicase [Hyphomicrobiales bacterium]